MTPNRQNQLGQISIVCDSCQWRQGKRCHIMFPRRTHKSTITCAQFFREEKAFNPGLNQIKHLYKFRVGNGNLYVYLVLMTQLVP